MAENNWFVYIIESTDGSLYTGITTDVERRFREHQGLEGKGRGAKFFRGRTAMTVRYREEYSNRSDASRREAEIKKMQASAKRALFEH